MSALFVQAVRGWVLGGLGVALSAAAGDVPHCEAPQAEWSTPVVPDLYGGS